MRITCPFNSQIPKSLQGNLEWRSKILQAVHDNPEDAALVKEACARDPLFFINGFCWTHDPRREPSTALPFILYPYQEEAILEILSAINDHDLLIEKSRDTGASWMNLAAMYWCWNFVEGLDFLLGSRVEDDVDKVGSPKALFWKIDFLMDHLPTFLHPVGFDRRFHRGKLHLENPENGSVFEGESTTQDFARGARCTAILLDEFASVPNGHQILTATRDATKCRLFNSTPKGTANAFYDIRKTDIKKLRIHWSLHPLKSVGLYSTHDNGFLKVLDPENYPVGYKPILDGKLRSIWYDEECKRAANSQEIAQELDIDYLGSGFQYFSSSVIAERVRYDAKPAIMVGELEYDTTTGEPIRFVECEGGHLSLWFLLDGKGNPPNEHKATVSADVSAGTGASNSCLAGYNTTTCCKIIEYVNPYIRPEAFATQAVAIAKWLGNAYMIWESGGPGRQFGSRIQELHYSNIYMRKREEGITGKISDIPGVVTTKEIKLILLGGYRLALEKGECINRSKLSLEDTLEYVFAADGGIEHSRSLSKIDPSGARSNHGDRTMADALAWHALRERMRIPVVEKQEIPLGCLAWRNNMRAQSEQNKHRNGWQ